VPYRGAGRPALLRRALSSGSLQLALLQEPALAHVSDGAGRRLAGTPHAEAVAGATLHGHLYAACGTPGAGTPPPATSLYPPVSEFSRGRTGISAGSQVQRGTGRDGGRAASLDPRAALPSARALQRYRRRRGGRGPVAALPSRLPGPRTAALCPVPHPVPHATAKAPLDPLVDTPVWQTDWVVHCQPVGSGQAAFR
jgi:hypothetical protein